eukprot:gene20587-27385_t
MEQVFTDLKEKCYHDILDEFTVESIVFDDAEGGETEEEEEDWEDLVDDEELEEGGVEVVEVVQFRSPFLKPRLHATEPPFLVVSRVVPESLKAALSFTLGVPMMAMCMSPDLSTGEPSQYPKKPTDLNTMSCLLQAQEHASQEEKATAVIMSDFQGEDVSASETCNDIRLPVLRNLKDVQGGSTHLSMATQLSITSKFGMFSDSDNSGAGPLLIVGSHSVIPQPPTFLDSDPLSQIDYALISADVPECHSTKIVVPRQSSHLRKAETKLAAPLSLVPYTTSVAKGGARAKYVHQDVQPLLIVGSRLSSSGMEFTPISGQSESVPKVQQHEPAYDPSQELSDIYLDRADMRLSAIRAGASSQQYRGSTTWYDFMVRSKQMPRTAHSGLRHFSGADRNGSPSPSNAAGSARH